MANAALIIVGDEILNGIKKDANTSNIIRELKAVGVDVECSAAVRDKADDISCALAEACRYDMVFITGGLGPTDDDLTRDGLSAFTGLPLEFNAERWEKIRKRFSAMGKVPAESNKRQACLARGAAFLDNPNGTAPGQYLEYKGTHIFILPGPPGENIPILKNECIPLMREKKLTGEAAFIKRIYICGQGESDIADMSGNLELRSLHAGYYFSEDGWVEVELSGPAGCQDSPDYPLSAITAAIKETYGIYALEEMLPHERLFETLKKRGMTISLAESLTGGYASSLLVSIPGASAVYKGGITVYSDGSKTEFLGIGRDILSRDGAVSEPVAAAMACETRRRFGTDCALSFTGIAGPGGDTANKPLGTVFTGYDIGGRLHVKRSRHAGSRNRVIRKAVMCAFCEMTGFIES